LLIRGIKIHKNKRLKI